MSVGLFQNIENDMCFNDCTPKYARSIILLIKSTIDYWTKNVKKKAKAAITG